jgi:HlyD family secretion protein
MHGFFRTVNGIRVTRRLAAMAVAAAVALVVLLYLVTEWGGAPAEGAYRLAKADRGEVLATVNATGAINPITTVIVGSQLSGQVVEILADYNSEVQADQVVARLNSDQIRAKLDAARADLEQMRATKLVQEGMIAKVKADTEKAHATQADVEAQVARNEALLGDSEKIFQRQSELRSRGYAAEQTYDTARSTRDAQQAALNSARAQVNSAKAAILGLAADLQVANANLAAVIAQIAQREAAVRQIEVDLRNTDIKSPVSGVVVQRNVELGATVAASLQAPTLFLIADDLHRMEIAANIDETDVGRIKPDQRVTFTVTAYPGRTFEGIVKQVRLGSQTVQIVVIYTTIVSIENPRLELLPGMTANLRIETDRRDNVVRIPNAALRWRPPSLVPEAAPVSTPAPAASAGQTGQPPRGGGAMRNTEFAEAVKTELDLDAAQTKEIDAAIADMRKTFTGNGGEQDQSARRERGRAARQDLEDRITAVLKPEQRVKFDEIKKRLIESGGGRASQVGRVFIVGKDGKPQGVTVRIGATDGGVTEIVSGLEAGRDVIIGGGPRVDPGAARGPRFGF